MKKLALMLMALVCWGAAPASALSEAAAGARDAAREYGAAVRNCDMGWALDFMYPPLMRTYADQLSAQGKENEEQRARRIMGTDKESKEASEKRMADNMRALRAKYDRMGRDMRAAGFKVESFSVGAPMAEYIVAPPTDVIHTVAKDKKGAIRAENITDGQGRSRFVVLPTSLVYSIPGQGGKVQRMRRDGCLFAVRDEVIPGNVNTRGTKLNKWYFIDGDTPVSRLRAFFPNLPLNIKTPPSGDRPLN